MDIKVKPTPSDKLFLNNFLLYLYKVMTGKIKIIDDIYHHPILGYGSIQSVYKESKSINNDITLNDVKEYFSKLPSKEIHFQYRK